MPTPKSLMVDAGARQVRAQFPTESLVALYAPLTMPSAQVKAHQELDRAVDLCYRPAAFPTELGDGGCLAGLGAAGLTAGSPKAGKTHPQLVVGGLDARLLVLAWISAPTG